jgi:DNA repair exonuclease SbcCD ATPase subunit
MVFGWGNKKPKQREADIAPEIKQITLTNMSDVIREIRSIRLKTMIAEVKAFSNKINSNRKTILNIATELERDNLRVDDMDPHLMRIVKRGKNDVISVIKKETTVVIPEINSFEDVKTFNITATRSLKKIGDALGRQSRIIHHFAKKYASKLKNDLKVITDENEEINILVKNFSELENNVEQIFENLGKYNQSQKSIVTLRERKKQSEKTAKDLYNTIKNNIEDVKNLKNSNEYSEFLEIKEKINSLFSLRNKIKTEVELQFSKISRPLNKYVYVSSMDKPQKKLLMGLIENPYDVLSASNKPDLVRILESVRRAVQSGSVSVKDIVKSVSQIDVLLTKLDTIIKEISAFGESKNDLESKLSIFNVEKLTQAENILTGHQNEKSDIEAKIKTLENEITDLIESLPKHIKSIQSKLNEISAVQYSIKPE